MDAKDKAVAKVQALLAEDNVAPDTEQRRWDIGLYPDRESGLIGHVWRDEKYLVNDHIMFRITDDGRIIVDADDEIEAARILPLPVLDVLWPLPTR